MDVLRALGYRVPHGAASLSAEVLNAKPQDFHLIDPASLPVLVVLDVRTDPISRPHCDQSSHVACPSEFGVNYVDLRDVYRMIDQTGLGVGVSAWRIWACRKERGKMLVPLNESMKVNDSGKSIMHTEMYYLLDGVDADLQGQGWGSWKEHAPWACNNLPGKYGLNCHITPQLGIYFHKSCCYRLQQFKQYGRTTQEISQGTLRNIVFMCWDPRPAIAMDKAFWGSKMLRNANEHEMEVSPQHLTFPGDRSIPSAPFVKHPALSVIDLQMSECVQRLAGLSPHARKAEHRSGYAMSIEHFAWHAGVSTTVELPDRPSSVSMTHNAGNNSAIIMRSWFKIITTPTSAWVQLGTAKRAQLALSRSLFNPRHTSWNMMAFERLANNLLDDNRKLGVDLKRAVLGYTRLVEEGASDEVVAAAKQKCGTLANTIRNMHGASKKAPNTRPGFKHTATAVEMYPGQTLGMTPVAVPLANPRWATFKPSLSRRSGVLPRDPAAMPSTLSARDPATVVLVSRREAPQRSAASSREPVPQLQAPPATRRFLLALAGIQFSRV